MDYEKIIKKTPVTMVEFYATWCPHCQKMMPVVDELKKKLEGKVEITQLDIDQNQELASSNGVEGIPTFIIYKNGEEQWRHSGEIEEPMLLTKIQSFL